MALGLLAPRVSSKLARVHFYNGEAFLAFYCAGSVIVQGGNPYRVQPLGDCEHRENILRKGVVEPAPLPGFALAPFALMSRLPYRIAVECWIALLLLSFAVTTWVLVRLTSLTWFTVFAALLPNAAWLNIHFGETVPLAVCALCLAAYALRLHHYRWAAIAAGAMMIEPHVGAPVVVAVFAFVPQCRGWLVFSGIIMFGISAVTLGISENLEYFRVMLPAHAHSEITGNDQYSLTWILHAFGANDTLAVRLGSVSYLAMATFGVFAAKRLARTLASPELIAFFPAAAVLIGGVFIHDIQMAIAIPAALILADRSGSNRVIAFVAVALVAVPWGVAGDLIIGTISLVAVSAIAYESGKHLSKVRQLVCTVTAAVLFLLVNQALTKLDGAHRSAPYRPLNIPASAQSSLNWEQYVRTVEQQPDIDLVGRKMLVWSGLLLVVGSAIATGSQSLRIRLK